MSLKINFFLMSKIILILLPITFITGPFLPDLFLSLLSLIYLINLLKNKQWGDFNNIFILIFVFFYFLILVSGILSVDPYYSLVDYNGPIFYFRYILFILAINDLLNKDKSILDSFTLVLFCTVLFVSFDGYFQFIFGFNIFGWITEDVNRITGVFRDEQILGHFLSLIFPLLLSLLVFKFGTGLKNTFYFLLLLILIEIIIFISGDRSGFFRIFQFTLLLIFLSNHHKVFRFVALFVSLVFIVLLTIFNERSNDRFYQTVEEVGSTSTSIMPWSPGHEKHYSVAIKMFAEKPFLGHGPQMFTKLCSERQEFNYGCSSHPHNIYFQTLAELGLLGLIVLSIFFIFLTFSLSKHFFAQIFKKKSHTLDEVKLILSCQLFIILWPLIPHQSFYNNHINSIIFTSIGLFYYFSKKN